MWLLHNPAAWTQLHGTLSLGWSLFSFHNGHLGLIFTYFSGVVFHACWQCSYDAWVCNPVAYSQTAHGIWDPHQQMLGLSALSQSTVMYLHIHSYAGVYNWMLTAGIHKTTDCLTLLSWGCVASSLFCANGILSTTLKQGYNGWLVNYMSPYRSVHKE